MLSSIETDFEMRGLRLIRVLFHGVCLLESARDLFRSQLSCWGRHDRSFSRFKEAQGGTRMGQNARIVPEKISV